jgi:hypothetical protein
MLRRRVGGPADPRGRAARRDSPLPLGTVAGVTALDLGPIGAEEAPVVIRDLFPAEVQLGDLVYRTAFAVITRRRLYVWQAEGRERVLRLVAEYDPDASTVPRYNAPPREPATLVLLGHPDASTAIVRRQRGCGCGSSLRGWRPWQPYRVASS